MILPIWNCQAGKFGVLRAFIVGLLIAITVRITKMFSSMCFDFLI